MSKPKPHKSSRPQRASAVTVTGRGKLTIRGNLNIIERQVIVNRPARARAHTSARTVAVAAILAHCTHQLGDPDYYRAFVLRSFGDVRLGDLADADLARVKQYVFRSTTNAE